VLVELVVIDVESVLVSGAGSDTRAASVEELDDESDADVTQSLS
jgi:hypothetical protein